VLKSATRDYEVKVRVLAVVDRLYSESCPILNVEGFLAQACLAIIDESIVDV
jgi:hypothetical protein